MKIINIFGAPSAGKSTTAAGVYAALKKRREHAEIVLEYAKELAWNNKLDGCPLTSLMILGEQAKRLKVYLGTDVKFVVTDSPLVMSSIYNRDAEPLVLAAHKSFDSINILLDRKNRPYDNAGRVQTHSESLALDNEILALLKRNSIKYHVVNSEDVDSILKLLDEYENN